MKEVYDPEFLGLQVAKMMNHDEALVFCPYHGDSNPSAEYNLLKGLFYCFGCQTSKTTKQLVEDLGGTLVPIAVVPESFDRAKGEEVDWSQMLRNPLALGNEYLQSRQVDELMITALEIRENKDGIIFPLKNNMGRVVGLQVRHYEKKPKYMFYGKRTPIWPMDMVQYIDGQPLFITEGVFGSLRAGSSADVLAVAMMGAGSVKTCAQYFQTNSRLNGMAVMDGDFAGQLAAGKFALMDVPVILPPKTFGTEPDEWDEIQWGIIGRNYEKFVTHDVNDIIERSLEPARLRQSLEKFWRKL